MPISTITSKSTTGVITSGTAVASTSGTSIDFTGIPSWVKRITVMFQGVSTNSTSSVLVQLGTSSGVVTSGYSSMLGAGASGGTVLTQASTAGIPVYTGAATVTLNGSIVITNISGNTWVGQGVVNNTAATIVFCVTSGSIALSGTLDRVRITSVTPDTFDAGSINILYE